MARRPFQAGLSVFLAFLIVLAMGNPVCAQVLTTGGISGLIVDQSGGAIANATLTISDPLTGFTRTATTNVSGLYTFSDLQPATYQLKVAAKGFADAVVKDVVVEAAHTVDLKVEMKVGTIHEVVEVSAQAQVLETTTNTLSTTLDPEAIQDLPLLGRDALQFAQLVVGATTGGQERFTVMDALPAAALNITVDGANDNFQRYRSTTTGFFTAAPLRIGAFDELTVSTNSLTADAGAEGATTLKFVTKRGTNQFHGTGFWQAENSVFNANSPLLNAEHAKKPSSHLNDYGGSLGGPLWKNKIFFFVNYESETSPTAYPDYTQVFTTGANGQANSEAGDFTYETNNNTENTVNLLQIAAANGLPSTVNSVTAGLLSQINSYLSKGILLPGQYSALSPGTTCCLMPVTNTLAWTQPYTGKLRYPTARVDYQITPKVALHSSWDLQWFQATGAPNYPTNPLQSNSWKATYFTTSSGLDWMLTPHLVNQFTFATESTIEQFNPTTHGDPFAAQADEAIYPPLSVNSVIPSFILNAPRDNPLWQFIDNVTWSYGNHTFTFGGSTRISTMFETEVNNPPTYNTGIVNTDPAIGMFSSTNFQNINTGNDNQQLTAAENLYGFLVGRISGVGGYNYVSSTTGQYQVEGKLIDREKQTVGGIYFQDAWRVNPHFALNYGFRWQLSGALTSTNNFWTSPTYANLLGPSSALFQPGTLNGVQNPAIELRAHPYSADLKEPAPNFGFAWNPDFKGGGFLERFFGGSNSVVRGGASISYYDEGWATTENSFYTNPGGYQSVYLNPGYLPGNFTPGTLTLGGTIPPLVSFPTSFATAFPLPEGAFTFIPQAFDTVDPNIRSPYTIAWNFGIQRKLPGNNVLEVAYVGNHVVHSWLQYDMNEVNIFENGFLTEFQHAYKNLQACENVPSCNAPPPPAVGPSFADNSPNVPGLIPLPIFDTAFAGLTTGPNNPFINSTFIYDLTSGQAGALAAALASTSAYFCNLVGGNSSFTPCAGSGGTGTYPINFFQANPYATGAIAQLLSDPGSSTYHALQVQWKHPAGHGLMLGANYTYSHALTNRWLGDYYTSDEVQYNFTTLRNPRLNKGPSPYDLRHQFKAYMTYALPFGANRQYRTGNRVLDNIIGGWTGGAIVRASSGLPFKLLGGLNAYNYSFATAPQYPNYPDASDSGVVLNGITLSQLRSNIGVYPGPSPYVPTVAINPQFLVAHPTGILPESTPGTLGQLLYLNGPKSFDVDFSLHKEIPIYEKLHMDIRAEFVNAFNHPDWAIPGVTGGPGQPADLANVSTSNYDALGLVSTPRTIEFRMQLTF